jgi:hypothetical protein
MRDTGTTRITVDITTITTMTTTMITIDTDKPSRQLKQNKARRSIPGLSLSTEI